MDFIYIGEIVNTHGIKGEIRLLSDFTYKKMVFEIGTKIYIGKQKIEKIITHYRIHKGYDMITLKGIEDINDVLPYKGQAVYCNRNDYHFPGILESDLIGMEVYTHVYRGKVTEIKKSKAHAILVITNQKKHYMIPYLHVFIEKIDQTSKKIYVKEIKGLFDED